jgi:iron(III) transport system substrate-binding protein
MLLTSRRFGLIALAAMAVLAAACGDDGDSTTTTASATTTSNAVTSTATGSITVYTGRSETLVKPLFEQFTADTGIKVEFRTGDSGELAGQILTEGSATQADVFFSQDAGALGALTSADLFDPVEQSVLDRVDPAYRADDGTWVGVSGRARVVVYDPAQVPTPPTGIDDVLDPKWKGKVGFAPTNASWQSFVTGLRLLRGEDGARTWLQSFAANDPVAFDKNGAVRDAVINGDIALGLVNHYYLLEKIAADGAAAVTAKNQFLPNDPGGLVNVAGVAILRAGDNKAAAARFVEYLLADASQSYFAEKTFEYPLVASIPASSKLPPLSELSPPKVDLSDLASLEQTQSLLVDTGLLTR